MGRLCSNSWNTNSNMKPFLCKHCQQKLGESDGVQLVIAGIAILCRHSFGVDCPKCERRTVFYVRRASRSFAAYAVPSNRTAMPLPNGDLEINGKIYKRI